MAKNKLTLIAVAMIVGLLMPVLVVLLPAVKTSALSGSEFEAGRIMDDSVFYDSGSMTAQQIQNFLNSKVLSCDTNGTQMYSSSMTRAEYGESKGYPPPYTCLKDYKISTPAVDAESGICGNLSAHTSRTAAQIISDVSSACGISPKVMIVLLQKEQGLVTDDWPWSYEYKFATGFCVYDTTPPPSCAGTDGFFNQIYYAARQFKKYKADPDLYNYRAGAYNNIPYNPDPSCGSSSVYIENQATAGLYNYTPYQPNDATLAVGLGQTATCGAYGNKNFWWYYNIWFGSVYGSYLLRSTSSATVYLITDYVDDNGVSYSNKYPITSMAIANALSRLGTVKFIDQAFLDKYTTQPPLQRLIKGPSSSTLYFFDSSIKLPFTSCTTVSDYGMSCAGYATLSEQQINDLVTGPSMTNVMKTRAGQAFGVSGGQKHEAFSNAALAAAGYTAGSNTLSGSVLDYLPYGTPLAPDRVIVKSGSQNYLYADHTFVAIPDDLITSSVFTSLPHGTLNESSVKTYPIDSSFKGFAQNSTGTKYVIDAQGKTALDNPDDWTSAFTTLDDTFLAQAPNSTQPTNAMFIRASGSSTIYLVADGKRYPIGSWTDFINLHTDKSTKLSVLSPSTVYAIPKSVLAVPAGSLVKEPDKATVYVIESLFTKSPLTTFAVSDDLGLSGVHTLPGSTLDAYNKTAIATTFVSCNGKNYVGDLGLLYQVTSQDATNYGWTGETYAIWDADGCANLKFSSNSLPTFIRPEHKSTIYQVDGGSKHPIASYTAYQQLGGNSSNTAVVSGYFADLIATGTIIY